MLDKEDNVGFNHLTSEINKPNVMVYMGLGWLAREDKIEINKSKKGTKISLK